MNAQLNSNTAIDNHLSTREAALLQFVPSIYFRDPVEKFKILVTAALATGLTTFEIKEIFIQLTIYAGFPKILESIQKLKTILHVDQLPGTEGKLEVNAPPEFNFFKLPKVQDALHNIDPDFAHFALLNAISLCDRPGLTPRERALIILASDICGEVLEGPFQIHVEMARQSRVPALAITALIAMMSRHPSGNQPGRLATSAFDGMTEKPLP